MENNIDNAVGSAFLDDPKIYGVATNAIPKPERNVGIDTYHAFYDNIITAGESGQLDIDKLQSFLQISQSREQIYQLLDTMSEDPIVSAVLETYAEDATEHNEEGRIVWCESNQPEITKYISYLLDTMNVDKYSYKWVHSLCKYGDLYIRLYRESDIKNKLEINMDHKQKAQLNEDVNVIAYKPDDKYVHYIESVVNPAEMFELTQFGKSYAYIKAPTAILHQATEMTPFNNQYRYQFNRGDVDVFDATTFVHASLEDNSSRIPETVDLFTTAGADGQPETKLTYQVRRGQSLLYNTFKIWRQMMLLENSLLLNRITKSSIVRIIGVEVGDMDKNDIGPKLRSIKSLIEQKTALNQGNNIQEYTNPGPMENNVYVPTKNGVGAITTQQVGGDVDVKGLGDIEYFKDRFFGALRVPKQYFGDTDDSTGFNGGTSLSIISSRYAKMVKRIQNCYIQALTDAINLMLLDKGLNSYVNNFSLHMVTPTTQEELDRRDNMASKVQITSDVMNLLDDIDNKKLRLQVLQSLLANVISNDEVLSLLSDYIETIPDKEIEEVTDDDIDINLSPSHRGFDAGMRPEGGGGSSIDLDIEQGAAGAESSEGEQILPSPAQLNAGDFTDNTLEF